METYLKKDPEGLKKILKVLDQLRDKNLSYFKNTFKYFLQQHPPFENSSIFYDPISNDFKFISNDQILDIKRVRYADYVPGEHCLIKQGGFLYSVIEPHRVIVAKANFILPVFQSITNNSFEDERDTFAEKFYNWYKVQVATEIQLFKNILYDKEPQVEKINKLF